MKKPLYHYLDAVWTKDPHVSLFDISVLRGFGVFDFLRTYNKKPFMLNDHIERFFNSAKELSMKVPVSKKNLVHIIKEGIKKNTLSDYNIRIVLTGGVTPDGISYNNTSRLAVLYAPVHEYPSSYYTKGISVITHTYEREYPQAKSLNYLTAVNVLKKAKAKKAVEVLYKAHDGRILEGTTSNFFVVIGKKLVTPKKDILYGITRKVVLEIAKKLSIPYIETDIWYIQRGLFDEAFVTASNKEVMPVTRLDGGIIGSGKVGLITGKIMTAYRKKTQ